MDITKVTTPAYVIDEGKLRENLIVLNGVIQKTGCRILLAQKAFSAYSEYPLIGQYLSGTTASGLYEARLGHEEMGLENHVYAPAFHENEIEELFEICDHIVFNSFSQLNKYSDKVKEKYKGSIGIRINPEFSTQKEHAIYDPCSVGSRLGVTLENFENAVNEKPELLQMLDGIHFHTLCEQNSDDLELTWNEVERKFGKYIRNMKWINMGGGHHITREDYDVLRLINLINYIKDEYGVQVYLEPGEAVALNAGYLITSVMDIVSNGMEIAILDASAACHMPDVLEMPYRPPLKNSGEADEKKYKYRLSSCTCLAGDVIGDYSFDEPLSIGDRLCFEDMAIYSMVKNNTFNGMALPSIYTMNQNGDCRLIRQFAYEDFKCRL